MPSILSVWVKNNRTLNHQLYLFVKMILDTFVILKMLSCKTSKQQEGNSSVKGKSFERNSCINSLKKKEILFVMIDSQFMREYFIIF